MDNQQNLFQLDKTVTYLNGAYMSPLLKSAVKIGQQQVAAKLEPYKISGDDFFSNIKAVKQAFSTLINAQDPDRIAIIPSVSYGLANVAKNVNLSGKEILVAAEQFPSNIYPWKELEETQNAILKTIEPANSLENRGKMWNERVKDAISEKTGMVAISHTHWADGTLFDLKAIRKQTNEVGALLILDVTQSVGAYPFDLQEIKPDALICGGYKWLLGPYGVGVAYYGPDFDNGQPIEQNWLNRLGSEDFAGLVNYEDAYQPGAMRYSVGEQSNFILVPMLLESLKVLNKLGIENIQQYCKSIIKRPLEELTSNGFWVENSEFRGAHLFGLRKQGLDVNSIRQKLENHRIFVSVRGSSIRVSPNMYNNEEDMMKLVNVLIN